MAALLMAAAPHLMAMPPWIAALILAATGWRLMAAHRRWRPPPRWLRTVLTLTAVAVVLVGLGGWGRRMATTLLCVMLAAKMMEMFRLRDLRMVAAVCFFLIATQFLFNERLIYLLYLAAGTMVAVGALVQAQRHEDARLQGLPEAPGDHRFLLRHAATMILAALPVALTLFVLFPRLAQPLWGLPEQVMDGRTGLSDSMSPGSIANLFQDESPAFRAEFENGPPPPQDRYWRGLVLWQFDGNTWRRSRMAAEQPPVPVPDGERSLDYRIQLEPHEQRWLFALDHPVGAPSESRITMDYQIIRQRPVTTLTQYQITSNPQFTDMPRLHDSVRQQALGMPPDRNPRTRDRAEALREQYPDDRDLIQAVLQWFNEEAFYYSLETTPTGRHGADEFLFDLRTGYCEHYASAFAILMRMAGIPTRVVIGYQGGDWQPGGGYLLVRQSDAHAWTEVWLEDNGWTRVDPTAAVAPDRIDHGSMSVMEGGRHLLDTDWLRQLRNRYDRLQHLWNRWILGFDADRQQRFMERLGIPDGGATALGLLMVLALSLVIGIVTLVALRGTLRERDRLMRAWRRLERRLRRAGIHRRTGETPLELLERASIAMPASARELEQLSATFARARYGQASQSDRDSFIELASRFRTSNVIEPTFQNDVQTGVS
ncbi:DUF3488 and DUF4129 domain-containing transglutaminase family protein [Wenzhouxiangella sp. AB-CW3]|uniref:transglutaminase TgpA family protein n=1 Tax=Wenzhouxiangella sp. AB-CW3 TaxID=2771012 RepID=UPI001CC2B508|nr:DUF3488 and transglutaminase-like domain-containing protein [Wenzhouxiangella sp. AB-CW3]